MFSTNDETKYRTNIYTEYCPESITQKTPKPPKQVPPKQFPNKKYILSQKVDVRK